MSKFNFNIDTQTFPVDVFQFAGKQSEMAKYHNVERVFNWSDVRGNVGRLPKYIQTSIKNAGYQAVCIGGTTFSHSVIGLKKA